MFRYMRIGSFCLLLSGALNNGYANIVQNIPACEKLKPYPLRPQEKIAGFPKPPNVGEMDQSILEDYYEDVAIAYADEAERLKQQAFEKRKLAMQQIGRTSVDNLRHGKSYNQFSVSNQSAIQQQNSNFANQLKKEASALEKMREEILKREKYFLCVADNIEQILSTKDPVHDK